MNQLSKSHTNMNKVGASQSVDNFDMLLKKQNSGRLIEESKSAVTIHRNTLPSFPSKHIVTSADMNRKTS